MVMCERWESAGPVMSRPRLRGSEVAVATFPDVFDGASDSWGGAITAWSFAPGVPATTVLGTHT